MHLNLVRQQLGYGPIAGRHAERLHKFHREVLTPYRNYHRPCCFPSKEADAKGKLRKRYRQQDLCMPHEKLQALPEAARYLRAGLDFAQLAAEACWMSVSEVARSWHEARRTVRGHPRGVGGPLRQDGGYSLTWRWKAGRGRGERSWQG
ncbi:MAG: hypothetical protein OXD30_06550 [Bryobacterales bacterium]|nr:hypothetical protein [Bryobacterales bacterium]